jgi:hypothetical protein
MGLIAHPVVGKRKSHDICAAFLEGFARAARPGKIDKGAGGVFYGINASNYEQWRIRLAVGDSYYYIDNSYFDKTRETHLRVTRDKLQFQGPDRESDGKRWAALGYEIKPWRHINDGHVVVCPQSETFMRFTARYKGNWLEETMAALRKTYPTREIRIRAWSSDKLALQATLGEDLVGAGLLVTHTSAAAITAAIEGVPILVSDRHALYGMPLDPRVQYMQALADNQWTLDEIKNGNAWRWLNR